MRNIGVQGSNIYSTYFKFSFLPHQKSYSLLPCPQRTTPEFHLRNRNLQSTPPEGSSQTRLPT